MESKKHKHQAYKLLKSLAFWMETNNNDYDIEDLDKALREIGIGDMSIGKYVKKYVKKFYYRKNYQTKSFHH